jgi:indoleamine 2,3-dioxygenase
MVSSRSAGSLPSVTAPKCGQDIGPQRGFLPTTDPLQVLPSGYSAWDEVGRDLPKLLAAGRARTVLEHLPILDADGLPDEAVHRAMLLLSFFGHAYVHQTWRTASAQRLPSVLARPWAQVARRLGRPPVLSYASYALDNWRRLDPHGPIALGNLVLLQNFLGGLDEEWFVTVHVEIEAEAAAALVALPLAQQAAASANRPALEATLAAVVASMGRMHQTLQRMPENCDPYIYYNRVRPFIHGWQQAPVVYEGVAEYEEAPQTFYGETGAQSTVVPCLDAVLGIGHQPDELRTYLRGMRTYMPPPHVAFLDRLEEGPSVRAFVAGADDTELRGVYDAAVAGVEAFRSTHLEYAARYIQKQAQVGVNSTVYGTGGTPFMRYLKKHRDETRRHRLDH